MKNGKDMVREIESIRLIPRTEKAGGAVVKTWSLVCVTDNAEEFLVNLDERSAAELVQMVCSAFHIRRARLREERLIMRDAQGRPSGALILE